MCHFCVPFLRYQNPRRMLLALVCAHAKSSCDVCSMVCCTALNIASHHVCTNTLGTVRKPTMYMGKRHHIEILSIEAREIVSQGFRSPRIIQSALSSRTICISPFTPHVIRHHLLQQPCPPIVNVPCSQC